MVSGESHQESCVVSCITIVSSDTLFPFTDDFSVGNTLPIITENHENSLQLSLLPCFVFPLSALQMTCYLFDISLLCIDVSFKILPS